MLDKNSTEDTRTCDYHCFRFIQQRSEQAYVFFILNFILSHGFSVFYDNNDYEVYSIAFTIGLIKLFN